MKRLKRLRRSISKLKVLLTLTCIEDMNQEEIDRRIERITKRFTLRAQIRKLISDIHERTPHDSKIVFHIQAYLHRTDLAEQTRYILNQLLKK
jgi:hypothetical protein